MRFKNNFHLAKKITLKSVEKMIESYPQPFPPAKYLIFIQVMINNGWSVKLYTANKVSKYVFVTKGEKIYKIRFPNHGFICGKEIGGDCDFYVGVSHTQCSTTDQIIKNLL